MQSLNVNLNKPYCYENRNVIVEMFDGFMLILNSGHQCNQCEGYKDKNTIY